MVEACVENGASCIDISGEPQVCDHRKMLSCIKDLLKEYLFSMVNVEHKGKFCLPIYSFKML